MKLFYLFLSLVLVASCSSSNGSTFKVQTPLDCYRHYQQIKKPGFRALAYAFDYPFFICGLSEEVSEEKYAVELALYACELGRTSPEGDIEGERAVMTHCRIYASSFVK